MKEPMGREKLTMSEERGCLRAKTGAHGTNHGNSQLSQPHVPERRHGRHRQQEWWRGRGAASLSSSVKATGTT